MAVPTLEFGKTSLPGDANTSITDLPDPSAVEFASPERAGITSEPEGDETAADTLTVADLTSEKPADETAAAPAEEGSKYAAEPDGDADADDKVSPTDDGGFTTELLAQAKEYGYDEASAKRFGSVENLQWAMVDADRRAAEWGTQQLAALQQQQQPVAQQPTAPAAQQPAIPPAQQQSPAQAAAAFKKFEVDKARLLAENWDEDTVNFLADMNEHYAGQMAEQRQYIEVLAGATAPLVQNFQQATSQSQADANAQFGRDIDEFITKLGHEWEAEFGKGEIYALPFDSPARAEREKLASTVIGLQVAEAKSNRPQRSTMPQLLEKAHAALHFQKKQELARKALAESTGKRRSQAVARAGGQRAQPMTGFERAVQRARNFERKLPAGA